MGYALEIGGEIRDGLRVIDKLPADGGFSEIYRVEKHRIGIECLLKVNLTSEEILSKNPNCKKAVYTYLTEVPDEERLSRELSILCYLRGRPNIAQIDDLIELKNGLTGILFSLPTGWPRNAYDSEFSRTPTFGMGPETMLPTLTMVQQDFDPNTKHPAALCRRMKEFINISKGLYQALWELGILELTKRGVIHRDIRPDNIVIGQAFTPYLIDFGMATFVNKKDNYWGSRTYAPPEIYSRPGDANSDCWHVGLVLYEYLAGKHLIDNSSDSDIRRQRVEERVRSLNNTDDVIHFYEELIQKFSEVEQQYLRAASSINGKGSRWPRFFKRKTPNIENEFTRWLAIAAFFCQPTDFIQMEMGGHPKKHSYAWAIRDNELEAHSATRALKDNLTKLRKTSAR